MGTLKSLFENNRRWSERVSQRDPDFFAKLSRQQAPDFLWIGCSDSRVPANEVVDLMPGELFVHRNVANVVVHSDMNCMSVLQFAVEQLQVEHIIVCGHYGCGGVRAALSDRELGLIDNWLRHIKDVYRVNEREMRGIADADERVNRLCELNVIAQVRNVCHTTIVQNAWARGQNLTVHGVIYGLSDGRLKDLDVTVDGPAAIDDIYHMQLPETVRN
ncbi:carbonate dehydratase [Ectothiorhodospiraceae bacterium WFHF3C12]|nr:carbonate dehydratase [Ectothiorhodospiraceae bacterium WFHF3C12]